MITLDEYGSIFDDFCTSRNLDQGQREIARSAWNAALEAVADTLLYIAADGPEYEPEYEPTKKGIEEVSQ